MSERVEKIRAALTAKIQPQALEIHDESHLHAGHAGAQDGRGHFRVTIVAGIFSGKPLIARHRLVYDAVAELMKTDIHALTIQAKAPEENHSNRQDSHD